MIRVVTVSLCLLLAGCPGGRDSEMQERIPTGKSRILTDEDGNRYAADHNIGDTYHLRPLDPVEEDQ